MSASTLLRVMGRAGGRGAGGAGRGGGAAPSPAGAQSGARGQNSRARARRGSSIFVTPTTTSPTVEARVPAGGEWGGLHISMSASSIDEATTTLGSFLEGAAEAFGSRIEECMRRGVRAAMQDGFERKVGEVEERLNAKIDALRAEVEQKMSRPAAGAQPLPPSPPPAAATPHRDRARGKKNKSRGWTPNVTRVQGKTCKGCGANHNNSFIGVCADNKARQGGPREGCQKRLRPKRYVEVADPQTSDDDDQHEGA